MKDTSSPAAPAPVGARHDDSSLFSLDSLKKTEEEAARHQQKQAEDSGLIDLKALALIAQEQRPKQEMSVAAVVAPADLFGGPSPIAPITAPKISTAPPPLAPSPNRTKLFVGAGVAVAVVAAVLAFALTRGGGSASTAPTATAAAAPPPLAAATVAQPDEPKIAAVAPGERPPPPKEDAKPAATATATATAAPKPVYVAPRTPKAPPKDDTPKPPPPPACDLACQMARAVNKQK